VFNVGEQDGFVIVSGDDRTPAIMGYASEGTFKSDELPQNMKAWLEGYAEQIEWLGHQKSPRHLTLNDGEPATDHASVAPLITTRWNQGSPYNDLCPIDPTNDNERSVTGCVATAMAQVLAYHRAPNRTVRPIPAFTTERAGIFVDEMPVSALDWSNKLNTYKGSKSDAQNKSVATLMLLCGASVEMDYTANSSGASSDIIVSALRTYFGYASSTHRADRNNYRATDWDALIYGELANCRPVLYGGHSAGGGHAFVIDGYDHDGLYHVNWGWGGQCDGYFLLSVLNPDSNARLACDHIKAINMAMDQLQHRAASTGILFNMLPEEFTLRQAQTVYEAIIGRKTDTGNFRRDIKKMLKPTGRKCATGGKAAELYRFNPLYSFLEEKI
jgi:hypothetical protein